MKKKRNKYKVWEENGEIDHLEDLHVNDRTAFKRL
jgi:hypothetical protein